MYAEEKAVQLTSSWVMRSTMGMLVGECTTQNSLHSTQIEVAVTKEAVYLQIGRPTTFKEVGNSLLKEQRWHWVRIQLFREWLYSERVVFPLSSCALLNLNKRRYLMFSNRGSDFLLLDTVTLKMLSASILWKLSGRRWGEIISVAHFCGGCFCDTNVEANCLSHFQHMR